MATSNTTQTDLYSLFGYWQNSLVIHPKELVIETLRKYFSEDSYYHYVKDEFGFPKTPDHTDLANDAGLNNDTTTRVFIGEQFRYDVRYYPSILVKHQGSKSVPLSFSRNKGSVQYENVRYMDGYGNETIVATPSYFYRSGSWEGTLSITVAAKDIKARDELVELINVLFVDLKVEDLFVAGLLVKEVSTGSTSEEEDRNDKIYKQDITLGIRSDWEQRTYVTNIIDVINICVDFGNLNENPPVIAPNLSISTSVEFIDTINNL